MNKENREFCAIVHVYALLLHVLEQRIGFTQQVQDKENFVEHNENKLVF